MRYSELNIETLRQAPARARTEGAAFLRRAGYVRGEGELTALGMRLSARVEELIQSGGPSQAFERMGLPVVETRSGEYYFRSEQGREEVARCASCGYAESRGLASFMKPDPAQELPLAIEKVLTPECHTIEALAQYLGIPKQKTAKALMYARSEDGKFLFVVIRGDMQLSEEKLKRHIGEFRAATNDEIIRAGAAPGYASPMGLKDALVVADDLIPRCPNLVAGANEPGHHLLNTNYGRDYQAKIVADVALAEPGAQCPVCGSPLSIIKADLLAGAEGTCMDNLLEALAQTHHDEKGLRLPVAAAPFLVYLMHVPGKEMDTRASATQLYESWEAEGITVLFDDRDERAGVKFADADLIGCPVRVTVGERGLKGGMVELKPRTGSEIMTVRLEGALETIRSLTKTTP